MKCRRLPLLLLSPGLWLLTGCESMTHTDKGVLGGGAIGAGTGALIGSATGHTGAGAAIGAAVGGLSGGLIGNELDQSEKKQEAQLAAATAPVRGPLSLPEIAQMAQQGISDPVIIGQIRTTRSIYNLTPADIQWLKALGDSDPVVMEMQATATRVPARVYARPYYQPDVVVVEPYAPPPVGVGFTYTRVRHW
jgi:surface antigen